VSELYTAVQQHHQSNIDSAAARLKFNIQHDSLSPRLRDYQKSAVLWMLTKEHFMSHDMINQSRG